MNSPTSPDQRQRRRPPAPDSKESGQVWRGELASERKGRRREQLLVVALDILAGQGWREVTVERLCSEAKLNKRYFYESFGNLEAVAEAVVDQLADTVMDALHQAAPDTAGLETAQYAETFFGAYIRVLVEDPRRARVLLGGLAATPALERRRADLIAKMTDAVTRHGNEYHRLPLNSTTRLGAATIIGGIGEAVIEWLDGRLDMPLDQLISEIASLSVRVGDGTADLVRAQNAARRAGNASSRTFAPPRP